jgi:hypothetical protein
MLSTLLTCTTGPAGLVCQSGLGLPSSTPSAGPTSSAVPGGASGLTGAATGGSSSGGLLSLIADPMASAAEGLIKTLGAFWMNVGTPQLTGQGTPVATITGDTRWIVNLVAVGCILVAAARLAIRRRGEPVGVMLTGLVRLVFVTAAATVIVQAAGWLGDQWSASLMSSAHLGANGWSTAISVTALAGAFGGGDGVLLIVALLLILSSLIQLMLMVLRVGLVIVLTGTLPLAAAASMCEWGESWWRKHVGWLVAWLLYKPAAALLFASAFALTNGKSLTEVLAGWMLLVLSVLILPALLRLIVPLTASLGGASGGGLALAGAGALASGAARLGGVGGIGAAVAARFRPSGMAKTTSDPQSQPDHTDPGTPSGSGAAGVSAAGPLPQPAAGGSPAGTPSGGRPSGAGAAEAATGAPGTAGGGATGSTGAFPTEPDDFPTAGTSSGARGPGDARTPRGGHGGMPGGPTGAGVAADGPEVASGQGLGGAPTAGGSADGDGGGASPSGADDLGNDGPSASGRGTS